MEQLTGWVVALILPLALGVAWLRVFWPDSNLALRWGYGYFLGVFIITGLLQLWGQLGLEYSFGYLLSVFLLMWLLGLWFGRSNKGEKYSYTEKKQLVWRRIVWWMFFLILVVRYEGLLIEVLLRPLFPWDAWMNWAPKAKTWFALGHWIDFVPVAEWPKESLTAGAYTLGNPEANKYPPLVPLIQTWTALGLGEWRDNWINMPWVMAAVALGLAFYGQLRINGVPSHIAMVATYLLLSMPYLNIHIALAGYADFWMAAYYTLATMSFINWLSSRRLVFLGFMGVFLLACIQTKLPGLAWACILLTSLAMTFVLKRHVLWFGILVALLLVLFVWIYGGGSVKIPYLGIIAFTPDVIVFPGLGRFALHYHSGGRYFALNGLWRDNWHLLGWVLVVLMIPAFRTAYRNVKNYRGPWLQLLMGVAFIFFVFLFTKHYRALVDSTTINRAWLHMLPATYYLFVLSLYAGVSMSKEGNKLQIQLVQKSG